VPPSQKPWGPPREPDPGPAWGPDPKTPPGPGPARIGVVGGVAVALAVSLAINVVLALRIKTEIDQQQRLRDQVAALQDEVDTLRNRGPEPTGGSVLERIAAAVEQIRELEFKKAVAPELLSAADLRERIKKQFAIDNPRNEIDELDKVLTAFGLMKPQDDLYDVLLDVQTEQIAGFYDTKTKKLVIGGNANSPSPLDRVLLAHEYTHALTDQHFDLTHFDELAEKRKDDEALAYLALIEGDATVLMRTYALQLLTPSEQQQFLNDSSAAPSDALDRAPNVIRESLLFPYQLGVDFVQAILEKGGIDALNAAYKDPPTSTEQIIHTSKYTGRRDDPTAVTVPNLARELGAGWKGFESGGFGEFDMRVLVDEFLSRGDATSASEGWDGGRFAAAESSGGVLVAALTAWDSESEAREATDLLGRWLPNRFGNKGQDMKLTGVSGRGWESPNGAGAVIRDGERVLLIIGPDRAGVEDARAAFPGF
ncbi:MAG: hypothetical protein ACRDKS_10850, partial [Actinomycetota bacterium]